MGDVSVASLILFIASIVLAAAVSGVLINSVGDVSDAVGHRSEAVSEDIRTDVEVVSDPGSPVYDSDTETITVYVKNTGLRRLDVSEVDVFLDGQYQTATTVTPLDGAWEVDSLVEIRVQVAEPLASGDHRLSVVAGADTEIFTFRYDP